MVDQVNATTSAARRRARRGGGAMVRGKREDGKKGKARDRETQDLPLVGLIFWLGIGMYPT